MLVAWDFETQPIEELPVYPPSPVGIALYKEGEAPEYLRWGHPEKNNCTEEHAKDVLTRLWNDPTVELIAHNNPFDSYVAHMKWQLPLKAKGQMHDTLVMAFLCDPHAMTYALKPLSEKLLGMPPEESDHLREYCVAQGYIKHGAKQYGEFIWLCPGNMVSEYACGDVERTMKLFHYYKAKIEEAGMWDAYLREMKLQPEMLENTRDGIRVDVDGLTRDVAMYDIALKKIDELLFQMLGCEPFNINSDAQLADAIDKAHPGLVWTLTKTGKRSTSKANMERTLEGLTGKLLAVMQYRASMQTCVNTFLRPWLIQSTHPLGGGRIRCQWNTTRSDSGGARTGRLSSSPSFMNIPTLASAKFAMVLKLWEEWLKDDFPPLPNVRAYVMPDIDEELVSLDFASQELRVLAHYEDDLLLKAYKEDPTQDLHQFAADTIAKVLGIPFKRKQAKTCIAEGSLVLTNYGLVKIEDITGLHLVWDGVEYVKHTGIVFKGIKEVINYSGLCATGDHEVYTNEYGKISFRSASIRGASLVRSGAAEQNLWVMEDNFANGLAKAREAWWAYTNPLVSEMRSMWKSILDTFRQYNCRLLDWMPLMQHYKVAALQCARPEILGNNAEVQYTALPVLRELWRSRRDLCISDLRGVCAIHRDYVPNEELLKTSCRPDRQQWQLRTREFESSPSTIEHEQQTNKRPGCLQRNSGAAESSLAPIKDRLPFNAARASSYNEKASCRPSVAGDNNNGATKRWAKVYDITNAGPRNRFTVSDCLVSNCAFAILYGSGLATLAGALGATKDEAGVIKNAYLDVLPGVKGLIEQLKARARTNQPLRTWGGRVYHVEPPRFIDGQWRSFEYKLLNYLIQSSSADITKTAIIEYAKRRVHGRFLLTVHDQIVVSVPTEHWISEAKILQDCMESIKLDAQLLADVSKGPNLHNVEDFKL